MSEDHARIRKRILMRIAAINQRIEDMKALIAIVEGRVCGEEAWEILRRTGPNRDVPSNSVH